MPPDPITVNLNGTDVLAAPGQMLIDLAEAHGIFIPRFCYHPGMASVAACRMCLVEVEGQRKLQPACATPVTQGMVTRTHSPQAVEAQSSVLELLLINHPLDCPICDRGGECPLQDQALNHGPGSSRYREPKRHFKKALPLSQLVTLDRERCVLCWRCVRFCREVSGDKEIELLDRGSLSQINTGPAEPFDSHFSGNTIQICPVGALTATPYRFQSRPWDLLSTATVCSFCSVGCPLSVERRGQEVLRAQALPNASVNGFWNCDKGRYGHRYVSSPDRLGAPLIRHQAPPGEAGPAGPIAPAESFEEISWTEALETVTEVLSQTVALYGPEAVGFIGGSHATNEDLYAANVLFRDTVGTPNLDFRTFDATFDYAAFAQDGITGSTASIDDLDHAQTILWFGPDPKEELPVLFLRLRHAVRNGARLLVAHPRRISLCEFGTHLPFRPGAELALMQALAGDPGTGPSGIAAERLAYAVKAMGADRVVVCAGQQFPGRRAPEAWARLASWIAGRQPRPGLLLCVPNANSQGALDFGIYPGIGAGQRPAPAGLGTLEMLQAAVDGQIKLLWLMGANVLSDLPDATLAARALRSGAYVVVSELFPTATALSADVVLPAAAFAEKEGSFTNLERRIQKVNAVVASPGGARADWQILLDVASRLGHPRHWVSSQQVAAEIARSVPTHAGFSWDGLAEPWAPVAGPADMPPELWHAAGESGPLRANRLPASQEGNGAALQLPERRMTTAWPLRWELRAVDATLRPGWVWPLPTEAGPPASGPPASGPLASGSPASGSPASASAPVGSPASGSPASASAPVGSPASGSPASGSPASGSPASGSPASGSPVSGSLASGSPASASAPVGSLASGSPASASAPVGSPASGSPVSGSLASGSPASGSPASASAPVGSLASGSPASASAPVGSPASGSPASGSPVSGSLASGSPASGSPVSGSLASGSPASASAPVGSLASGSPASGGAEPPEGALRLLSERAIYDAGAMISRAPDLRGVTAAPFVELHPDEAAARGLSAGATVTVTSTRCSVRAALRCSTDTPAGALHMLYDQPGLSTNALLDSAAQECFVGVSP